MALILVIDDDAQMRRTVRRMLATASHSVMEAANGKAGIELMGERVPDLVVTDILMPERDGIEVIRDIRREYPGIKVVAISGGAATGGTPLYLNAAQKLGADAVIEKPFHPSEFLALTQRLLSTSD
jgi:CheY-like chemotaxis protein